MVKNAFKNNVSFLNSQFNNLSPRILKLLGLGVDIQRWRFRKRSSSLRVLVKRHMRALKINTIYSSKDTQNIYKKGALIILVDHQNIDYDCFAALDLITSVRTDLKVIAKFDSIPNNNRYANLFLPMPTSPLTEKSEINKTIKMSLKILKQSKVLVVFPGTFSDRNSWAPLLSKFIKHTNCPAQIINVKHEKHFMDKFIKFFPKKIKQYYQLYKNFKLPKTIKLNTSEFIFPQELEIMKTHQKRMSLLKVFSDGLRTDAQHHNQLHQIKYLIEDIATKENTSCSIPEYLHKHFKLHSQLKVSSFRSSLIGADIIKKHFPDLAFIRKIAYISKNTPLKNLNHEYDNNHNHLLVINDNDNRLASSMRLKLLEPQTTGYCLESFSSAQYFSLSKKLFKQIPPGLEVSDFFVEHNYRKQPLPLFMLWQSLGKLFLQNDELKKVYGTYIIDERLSKTSLDLIHAMLSDDYYKSALASNFKPHYPFQVNKQHVESISNVVTDITDFDELNVIIRRLERGKHKFPNFLTEALLANTKVMGIGRSHANSNDMVLFLEFDFSMASLETLERYFLA